MRKVSARRKTAACILSFVLAFGLVPAPAFAEAEVGASAPEAAAGNAADGGSLAENGTGAVAAGDASGAEALDGQIALLETGEATYDEVSGCWATTKGVVGAKAQGDNGYVEGATTPAQLYFTIDEETNDITVTGIDNGATAAEVPEAIDGNLVVEVGGFQERKNLKTVTFAERSQVARFGSRAFAESAIETIALPDSLKSMGESAFSECQSLRAVNWPNNSEFTAIPEYAFQGCKLLSDDVVASIPASVTVIGRAAFVNCASDTYGGGADEPFTEIVIPDTVKRIESGAFRECTHVRSVVIGSGVEYIGDQAFYHLSNGAGGTIPSFEGVEVVIPQSVKSMGEDVFNNEINEADGSGQTICKRNAPLLRVMNPDFSFESGGSLELDGQRCKNPFSIGQTIIAYASNSEGKPSWIKRFADSVAGQMDEKNSGKPAYTFQWMEEQVQVSGKVPAGASVTLLQNGKRTAVEVAADGTFKALAFTNASATVCVSLAGYYDKAITRQASEMTGEWSVGEIVTSGEGTNCMERVPVSRNMAVNVMAQTSSNDAGSPVYEPMALADGLTLTLSQGTTPLEEGEGKDFTRQNWGFVLSETLAEANAELTLSVEPDPALKLAGATVSAKPEAGAFDVKLLKLGTATVQVKSSFAGASTVMVFDAQGKLAASGDTAFMGYDTDKATPIMKAKTPQLAAGEYTVVAVSQSGVKLAAPTLAAFELAGLEEGKQYAKTTIAIENGKDKLVVLEAPAFDVSSWRKSAGIESCGFIARSSAVVEGGEIYLRASYTLRNGTKATKLALSLADDQVKYPNASTIIRGESSDEYKRFNGAFSDGALIFDLSNDDDAGASRAIDICLTPKLKQAYSVSASLTLENGATVPLGSAAFDVVSGFISLDSDEADASGNKALVYAPYDKYVALRAGDGDGSPVATGLVGGYGYASLTYNLPVGTIMNERVKLTAAYGDSEEEARTALTGKPCDTAYVKYVPRAKVSTFKVTNRGYTQTLIENGEETRKGLVTRHQFANKRNAYWTFDLTLSTANGAKLQDGLSLMVLCMGGQTVQIPLKKREEGQNAVRFTGEYVDEGYLKMVKDWEEDGRPFSLGSYENVFVPQTYAISTTSLGLVVVDAEITMQKANESADKKKAEFNSVLVKGSGELADEAKAIDEEFDKLIDGIAEDLAKDSEGASAEELACAIKSQVGSASAVLGGSGNADGITIDKMIFEDAYSPDDEWYADWAAAEADADPATRADIAAIKNAVSQNDAALKRCEDEIGKMIGVGSLTQYDSWTDAFTASLAKNAGVKVKRSKVNPSGYQQFGGNAGFKPKDDDTISGYSAYIYDNESDDEDPIYLEADFEDIAESDQQLSVDTNKIAVAASAYENITSMVTSRRKAFTALGNKVGVDELAGKVSRNLRRLKGMEVEAKMWGVSAKMKNPIGAGLGALDAGFSCYAANDAIGNYEASWTAYNQLKGDLEGLEIQRDNLARKDPKSEDDIKCLNAMNKELAEGYIFRDLLEVQAYQDESNAKVAITLTAGSAAATLASGGTAGVAIMTTGALNDASSVTANTLRAEKLNEAQANYEYARALRERSCEGKIVMNPGEMTDAQLAERAGHGDAHAQTALEARYAKYRANCAVDPSGFVYEAVESNLVEGATATIWKADNDQGANEREWNAEPYEQENPLTTNANGVFNWDVPTGWYQIRVTKAGYGEARSAWLPVPPIQLGIKLGLVSTDAPTVARANAYTDCIEIEFSQYMDASSGAVDALSLAGLDDVTFEWIEATDGAGGKKLSKVLRIKPATPLPAGSKVSLGLSGAKNYAGTTVAGGTWSSGELTVGMRPAELKLNIEQGISVIEGDKAQVVAYVRDASGNPLPGVRVSAAIDSTEIASLSAGAVTTDSEGKATFDAQGVLAGLSGLFVAVDDTTLAKDVDVRVCADQVRPARPVATLGSVTLDASAPKENCVTVPRGTRLVLSAEEGATIYYSTNNTCPCRDEGRIVYAGPITLTQNGYYRIAAYKAGLEDEYSERLNITVTVEGGEPGPGPAPGPEPAPGPAPGPDPKPGPDVPVPVFGDVDYGAWYAPGVSLMAEKGLMRGYDGADTFGVGKTLTRAELATILWRYTDPEAEAAFTAEGSRNETGLPDVLGGQWYTGAVNWAVSAGVINGYQGESGMRTGFGPDDPVTCEQLLTILHNLKGTSAELSSLDSVADAGEVSAWAKPAAAWALEVGLVRGYACNDGSRVLVPAEHIARERVATVFANAFELGIL